MYTTNAAELPWGRKKFKKVLKKSYLFHWEISRLGKIVIPPKLASEFWGNNEILKKPDPFPGRRKNA